MSEDPEAHLAGITAAQRPDLPPPPTFTTAEIDEALAFVPRFARHVFLLHRLDGLCYREIALRLGISERRVERAIVRALTRLRHAMDRIERRRR
jgi:DNA-directed RNA polymerase specialized sigma24 family protein